MFVLIHVSSALNAQLTRFEYEPQFGADHAFHVHARKTLMRRLLASTSCQRMVDSA